MTKEEIEFFAKKPGNDPGDKKKEVPKTLMAQNLSYNYLFHDNKIEFCFMDNAGDHVTIIIPADVFIKRFNNYQIELIKENTINQIKKL